MFSVTFRFYGSLNDFLPKAQHNRPIRLDLSEHDAVKHSIEALGVPHPEVEAILANGRPVDFSHRLQDGDNVEVFPLDLAERLSEHPALRPPLRRPIRFVADTHLGRLAAYLRLLGFDTLYRNDYGDHQLAAITANEERVLLTRDRGLLKHKIVVHGYCVREADPHRQVISVLQRYQVGAYARPWQRCIHCNGLLHAVDKSAILSQLQPKTRLYYDKFQQCAACGQIYWEGSHFDRMSGFVEEVLRQIQD